MTAAKEVQPYSVAYEGERIGGRFSATDAPTIDFDRKTSVVSSLNHVIESKSLHPAPISGNGDVEKGDSHEESSATSPLSAQENTQQQQQENKVEKSVE